MQNFIEKLGWQKVGAAAILVAVLMFIFIIYSFILLGQKSTAVQQNEATPTSTPVSEKAAENISWKTYKNSDFKIDYPSNLNIQIGATNTNDFTLVLSGDPKSKRFEIQVYNPDTTSVNNLIQIFSHYGYTESSLAISGINANVFNGSVFLGNQHLYETAIIFQAKGKIYKIQTTYNSVIRDSSIELVFTRILESFNLL